jgi:hypothetical protein
LHIEAPGGDFIPSLGKLKHRRPVRASHGRENSRPCDSQSAIRNLKQPQSTG